MAAPKNRAVSTAFVAFERRMGVLNKRRDARLYSKDGRRRALRVYEAYQKATDAMQALLDLESEMRELEYEAERLPFFPLSV